MRTRGLWVLPALGAVAVLDMVRVVERFGRTVVIEDHTIIWYAAEEWLDGRLRQPNYYGQTYGTTLEGIPIGLVHAILGLSYRTAMPLVLTALALAPWFLFAYVACRRDHPVLATLAVAAPLLMSTYLNMYVTFYGAAAGRALGAVAAAVALGWSTRTGGLAAATALGTLAFVLDSSSALVVVPVLLWALLEAPTRQRFAVAAIATVPAAAVMVAQWAFYRRHPDYDLFPAPGLRPSLHTLADTMTEASRWRMFAPELLRFWLVPVAVALGLVAWLVATRRASYVVPGVAFVVVVVFVLANPRAADDASPLLPGLRVFMPLPAALWCLAWMAAESAPPRQRPVRLSTAQAMALIAAVAVLTAGVRGLTLTDRASALIEAADRAEFRFPVISADDFETACRDMHDVVSEERIDLVILRDIDRALAYGCGAEAHGRFRTLYPEFERRTWLLEDEAQRERTSMIVWGADSEWCTRVVAATTSCRLRPAGDRLAAVMTFEARPAIDVLRDIGVAVRPFGPGCEPRHPATCD